MPLPLPQIVSTSEFFVSGDVTIHASAVIAPGSILRAAPNSRIVIGSGACLGMGVVLNAYQGEIEIQSGSVLGAGVLIIGRSTIGDHACVGPTTTIFNASVAPHTIVPAGSLLGDTSRQIELEPLTPPVLDEPDPSSPWDTSGDVQPPEPIPTTLDESPDISAPEVPVLEVEKTEVTKVEAEPTSVVGQVYINQLLLTLFPERRHFKSQQK